jgi:adenosylcobinamide-GDP ribazoletransferase
VSPVRRLREEGLLVLVALQFLTRLPVRLPHWSDDWLNRCVRHFPLVGACVGLLSAWVLLLPWWPPLVLALLVLALQACITGAFHEDGLADSFDALGGAVSREKALAIMKDSRIGSYGALALVLVTGLRAALLAALIAQGAWFAFAAWVAVQAWARWTPLLVMGRLPYAGDAEHAKAKPLALAMASHQPWLALPAALLALAPLAWLVGTRVLLVPLLALLVALAMVVWLRRRLGGYTGDTLGATEQLAEVALLLAICA